MKLVQSPNQSEMHLVETLDGYEGWGVLSENVERLPKKWERWNGQEFAEDSNAKQSHENAMKANDKTALVQTIEELEARVAELEAQLANQLPV